MKEVKINKNTNINDDFVKRVIKLFINIIEENNGTPYLYLIDNK